MNITILGSSKPQFKLSKEEAIKFGGKSAGICYMPGDIETLFSEPEEKTLKRADMTLSSGHHSVFDHTTYNLALEGIPKILAMILNNEKMYTTSEKSARYTKMKPSEREEKLYEKWIEIYKKEISNQYPEIDEKRCKKLAQENARYLISVFTPATTMEYSVSLRQLNYIAHWFEDYIKNEEDTDFNKMLKPYLQQFIDNISDLLVPELNTAVKGRKISLFDSRKNRNEEFGENYCTTYLGTFAEYAQNQRHRTLQCQIRLPEQKEFYVPKIIAENEKLKAEWLNDIGSLADLYPQGMLIQINERGTAENFILKCQERVCGCAQLEIMEQTFEIMKKYMAAVKNTNEEIYNLLLPYSKGARCTYPGFKCTAPCIWGAKNSLTRKI
ncbi:MAG: FAD-dependent thymidylate synthase [Clostridia bacterium]|nr:FAD-dependent thymidylate synthase [Clostridia bacterium]